MLTSVEVPVARRYSFQPLSSYQSTPAEEIYRFKNNDSKLTKNLFLSGLMWSLRRYVPAGGTSYYDVMCLLGVLVVTSTPSRHITS